jgi:ABC-type transporter Mla MlaB component
MIRVTKSLERGRIVITIDGQLSGDYIQAVEISCNQALSEGKPVDVFLHDVLTIDQSGVALLTRLAAKGVRLLATGVYTSYIVRDILAACGQGLLRENNTLVT